MTISNEAAVREAYEAFGHGDVERMLEFFDPELEWTYLDPAFENAEPATCHGLALLRQALQRQVGDGLTPRIEEIAASGDHVMVAVHMPGLDQQRVRQAEDRNFLVLTFGQGRIVKMRACRDRAEARAHAGIAGGAGGAGGAAAG